MSSCQEYVTDVFLPLLLWIVLGSLVYGKRPSVAHVFIQCSDYITEFRNFS